MVMCKQILPLLNIPGGGRGGFNLPLIRPPPEPQKVVVVMGATGTGKSKLSIDLAIRFRAEIVNSDKIQVYEGHNIVTNKITKAEQRGVQHHLLGSINPNSNFTAANFTKSASLAIKTISDRAKLPIIVGGSNSFIEALIENENYELCFLWVDVSIPVLHSFVSDRVDRMVEEGMADEVRKSFNVAGDYSRGVKTAIGFPEFDRYFRMEAYLSDDDRANLLRDVIDEIKSNTRKLACRQLEKIHRLRNEKEWKLHRLDATDAFRKQGRQAEEAWERLVARPGAGIVSRFILNARPEVYSNVRANMEAAGMETTVMAAGRH